MKLKLAFYKIVQAAAFINIVLYLLACLTPFISAAYFFPFTFLALGFPVLLMGMVFWLVVCLCWCSSSKKKKVSLFLFIILLGYKNIVSTVAFHPFSSSTKSNQSFRVLSWNVKGFISNDSSKIMKNNIVADMMLFIKNTNADILCVQDFEQMSPKPYCQFINYITDSLHFPYHYYSVDLDTTMFYGSTQYGTCIFSKYPIQKFGSIAYSGKHFTESLGFADVIINNKPIRIFNTHLRSMYLGMTKEYTTSNFKYIMNDTNIAFHSTTFDKLKYFDTSHINQAKLIKKVMDTTTIPFIFCADLNSVPSSYIYHYISNNLNDAFVQQGLGWGGTYSSSIPFYRIDVVLMSKALKAIHYVSPKLELSDHYPVVVDIGWW